MTDAVVVDRLFELETVIDRGRRSFIEVGNALAEIRETRLYRETHATFEEYCKDRWGLGKAYSHQLMAAAGIVSEMSARADIPVPVTEAQVRQLGRIDDADVRTAVWEKVVETDGENATAKIVKHVVDAVIESQPTPIGKRRDDHAGEHVKTVLANLPPGPQQTVLDTRAWVSSCLVKGRETLAIVPAEVVPMLDEAHRYQVRTFIAGMREWMVEMEAEMQAPLHALEG